MHFQCRNSREYAHDCDCMMNDVRWSAPGSSFTSHMDMEDAAASVCALNSIKLHKPMDRWSTRMQFRNCLYAFGRLNSRGQQRPAANRHRHCRTISTPNQISAKKRTGSRIVIGYERQKIDQENGREWTVRCNYGSNRNAHRMTLVIGIYIRANGSFGF